MAESGLCLDSAPQNLNKPHSLWFSMSKGEIKDWGVSRLVRCCWDPVPGNGLSMAAEAAGDSRAAAQQDPAQVSPFRHMVLTSWSVLIPMDEPLWTQSPRVGVSLVRTRTLGLVGLWGPLGDPLPLPPPFPARLDLAPGGPGPREALCMGLGCKVLDRLAGLFSQWLTLETQVALGCLRLPLIFSRISQQRNKHL